MTLGFILVFALFAVLVCWYVILPAVAARITMSKWFRRATMGDDFE